MCLFFFYNCDIYCSLSTAGLGTRRDVIHSGTTLIGRGDGEYSELFKCPRHRRPRYSIWPRPRLRSADPVPSLTHRPTIHQQPLATQYKGVSSKIPGCSENATRVRVSTKIIFAASATHSS